MCVGSHVHIYLWRQKASLGCLSSGTVDLFYFFIQSLSLSQKTSMVNWLTVNAGDSFIFTCLALILQANTIMPGFVLFFNIVLGIELI